MALDYFQNGFPDFLRIQGPREGPDHRQVIDRLGRGLHALEIEARLLESQRLRTGPMRGYACSVSGLPGNQGGEDFVLDALQGRRLDEGVHVHRDTVFLVQLHSQPQG